MCDVIRAIHSRGSGYQVQLSETCSSENDVQLVTCAIPQTASEEDSDAVEKIHDKLKDSSNFPEEMLADTVYGSDDNVQSCMKEKVDRRLRQMAETLRKFSYHD